MSFDRTRRAISSPRHAGVIALLLVVAAGLVGCSDDGPETPQPLEAVKVTVAHQQPVARSISLTGTIAAQVESNLSFRVAGRIAERRVDVSDHVKAGDILATLDTSQQEADIRSAQATLDSAKATLTQAQASFERQKRLIEGGYTTRSSFDSAEEQLRTAQSALDSATADLGTAEDQLSFTTLRADSDGIITSKAAETGQVVASAQTVFTLAHDGDRDAVFDIYEALLAGAPPSEPILVTLVANPAVSALALVREVSPTFDTTTGTVRVKMSLIDPPPEMTLGVAVAGLGISATKSLFILPWTALSAAESGQTAVWIVDPQTKAVSLRTVIVDRYKTGQMLVSDGLKDGETVVTAGGQFLHEGQVVSIAPGEVS